MSGRITRTEQSRLENEAQKELFEIGERRKRKEGKRGKATDQARDIVRQVQKAHGKLYK